MNDHVVIGVIAVAIAALIPTIGGLWKLATMLAEVRTVVRTEFRHENSGSTKDYAKRAAQDVESIRVGVEYANHRIDELQRQGSLMRDEMDTSRRERTLIDGQRNAEMAALSHDVRTVRTSQALLTDHVDRLANRIGRLEARHDAPPVEEPTDE